MRKLYFLYFVSALQVLTHAQTYNFSQYAEEKGLAQSYIYCISQSRQGDLVLSAGEAICRFDGLNFTSVYDETMKENIVVTHFIDARNVIWLGHQQYGLSYIDYMHPKPFKHPLLADVKISQIIGDDQRRVWLAGSNGVYSIDTAFTLTPLQLPQSYAFSCLLFDRQKHLLAGASTGLLDLTLSSNAKRATVTEVAGLKDKMIKQIVPANSSGRDYWVLTDDGVYGISFNGSNYEVASHIANEPDDSGTGISCIYHDAYDNLWLSAFGIGLRKLSFKGNPVHGRYSTLRINKHNGLKSQNIQSIFQDSEGNMWFGTFGEGLIKKPMEMFSFFGKNEGIRAADVKKVITDNTDLWMATGEGLAVFNRDDKNYQRYDHTNGFVSDKVTTLFKDAGRRLWIGTLASGVYVMDLKSRTFENFSQQRGMPLQGVNCITQAGKHLFVATTDGIFVFDRQSLWSEHLSMNEGLLHNNVNHIFEDSKRRLWISSHGAPPYYIFSQKVTAFKNLPGLNSYNSIAACEDNQGNIWLATDGDGVFKYDNNTFYNYTTEDGLLSNYCTGIETDKNNSIWVAHRSGLSELKERLKKFSTFTASSGLLFPDNNINAIYKDSADDLWFGTTQGIIAYNIESGKVIPESPAIFINDIQLNKEHFLMKEPIEKPYGYYSVHIDYKAVSLSDPTAIYYRYRLMDVDTAWKTTNMPYIDFPKLGDGDYTFEVVACNSAKALCSVAPARIAFSIQRPLWKHVWFYLLIACAVILIARQFVLYRTRALKRTQALLQLKVEQKTFLLKREKEAVEQIKTDLEHKNKDITDSIYYAKNIQDSLLPPDELMKDLFFGNCFVLFKPKDIVSGDFYWCSGKRTVNGDVLHLAAVVDCTGHGVPGAFLSILANDFLKQSLTEERVALPNEILNYLNSGISSHLNQHASKNTIRDGMDIALIGINYSRKKLYYSGANNPIYIFRETEHGVEEIIVKATKQAIGSVHDLILDYELHIFDLVPGDTIYLFSDGYADQFGGERNKKITYKTFRSILSEAFLLPMCQQRQFIDGRLEEWKKDTEQTDDVCVMGIRI